MYFHLLEYLQGNEVNPMNHYEVIKYTLKQLLLFGL